MNTRLLAIASAAALMLALTACTAQPDTNAAPRDGSPNPVEVRRAPEAVEASPTPTLDPDSCDATGWTVAGMDQRVVREVRDRGARSLAAGTVGRDVEGRIVTYTVAEGDAPDAIGQRLCIRNALSLATLNHTSTIHPRQVLRIFRDPALPEVLYHAPQDAPGGFEQIPYQRTLEAMGAAADAGDVATVRRMWNDTLSGMFLDEELVARIQKEVDAGHPEVLQQLFS